MRILLTGATGFIGRRLGVELALRGHEIFVLTRKKEGLRARLPFPHQAFIWNPEKGEIDPNSTTGVQAVVHLAGTPVAEKRWTPEIKKSIRDSRLKSTALLVERFKTSTSLEVFLSASAIGIYGDRGEEVLSESSEPGQGFLAEVCKDWENAVLASSLTARRVTLRFGIVLGRGGGALERMLPIFKNGAGGPIGSGRQWMSWVHVDDITSMVLWALETKTVQGAFNAVAPQPVRNAEFTQALGRVLSRPAVVPVPAFGLKLVFGEMSEVLLGSQRVKSDKIVAQGFEFKYSELEAALKDLYGYYADGEQVFEEEAFLDRPVEELWDFFSSEKNLETLTPSTLKFEVLKKSTPTIQKGTLIDYRLKIHGVPAKWRTEITEWKPLEAFVDNQVSGPYALWHHTHSFKRMGRGTYIKDKVRYKLPLGPVGRLFGGAFVRSDISGIFAFREKKMAELFPDRK